MLRVFTCLTDDHNPWLIIVAGALCLAGAGVSIAVLRRAAQTVGWSRAGWLLMASVATGTFVWCTHFIAMLAYEPGAMLGFDLLLTLCSVLLAVIGCGAASTLAVTGWRGAATLGGAGLGLSIGLMHYAGMAAFGRGGVIAFDRSYVVASLLAGTGCAIMALRAALRSAAGHGAEEHASGRLGAGRREAVLGTLWLGLAVVSLHLTGMTAVTVTLPRPLALEGTMRTELALAAGGVGLLVLAAVAAAWMIDHQTRAESGNHLRRLADSAMEGLAITQDGLIIEANDTFRAMVGIAALRLLGMPLPGTLLTMRGALESSGGQRQEGRLSHADGSALDVEVVTRDDVPSPGMRIYAFRDLRERREQERRILYVAMHDALTGLPNRARFAQRMDQMLQLAEREDPPHPVALLHLDLDRFKDVNDLHGHAGGDALLRGIGRRLSQAIPAQAFAARLGSDEFGVLLPFTQEAEVFELIVRLESALAEPNHIGGGEVSITAATGIALFPTDATRGDELRAYADLAMRRAKASAGRGLRFYHAEIDVAERHRRQMSEDMRAALKKEHFRLYAQLQIDITTSEPCGHEMLLRWLHPEHGLIPPADFIPLAEENGLILPIGEWVLREACAMAAAHPHLGKVAVNLSPVQFSQPDLPQQVASALAASGLSPWRLELEITETTLMQDQARTVLLLKRIKALGVSVAIDDFGTGYSSLSTLRSFPFDKIKLDRSFMAEIETSPQAIAILRAVIGIGRGLDIPVLAEGVETETQLTLLRAEGCAEAQGYLFGRPEPVPGNRGQPSSNGTLAA